MLIIIHKEEKALIEFTKKETTTQHLYGEEIGTFHRSVRVIERAGLNKITKKKRL